MKIVALVARILLGLIFVVFGLNGFLGFIPQPELPETAGKMMGALGATGYFFPVLKIIEILSGLLVLSGRFTPVGVVMLAPIGINIFLLHAVLAPAGMPVAIAIVVLQLILAYAYWDNFKPLFEG